MEIKGNPYYTHILILDSEGLQGDRKDDEEFDRKMCCFILAISDYIIINSCKDINAKMKNLLEICCISLSQLEKIMNKQS